MRGRDIKRYGYDFADLYLINTHNGVKEKGIKRINIEDYPAVKAHLDLFYPQLEKRADQGDTPYNLRNCAYIEDFYKQKIVWLELTDKPKFTIDNKGYFPLAGTFLLTTNFGIYTILATLNSKLIEWLFDGMCNSSGTGTNQWKKFVVERIPIPKISIDEEERIKKLIQSNNFIEANKFIYELYNLDNEEISLIENI